MLLLMARMRPTVSLLAGHPLTRKDPICIRDLHEQPLGALHASQTQKQRVQRAFEAVNAVMNNRFDSQT